MVPDARRTLCIVNPAAGAGRGGSFADVVLPRLREVEDRLEVAYTERPGHASEIAAEGGARADLVIAAGGDGMVSEVVHGLVGGGHAPVFATIPLGSACDFALNLGVRDIDLALSALERGIEMRLDVGEVCLRGPEGPARRHFVLTTGTGFSARVIERATPRAKRLFRANAYTVAGVLAAVGYRPPLMRWRIDGEEGEGRVFNFVVASAELESGGAPMSPGARLDDGRMHVGIWRGPGGLRGLWRMRLIFSGEHIHQPGFVYRPALEVEIDSEPPAGVQVDGEVPGRTPASFRILPGRLRALTSRAGSGGQE